MSTHELKKALLAAGFEVYRTVGDEVLLADRVRDNLIMDSGVRVRLGDPLQIGVVFGVRQGEFPNENSAQLYERVRRLAASATAQGYSELSSTHTALPDPADPSLSLDTYYEVAFAKPSGTLSAAMGELRIALALSKVADPRR